jgi:hypothetical protein
VAGSSRQIDAPGNRSGLLRQASHVLNEPGHRRFSLLGCRRRPADIPGEKVRDEIAPYVEKCIRAIRSSRPRLALNLVPAWIDVAEGDDPRPTIVRDRIAAQDRETVQPPGGRLGTRLHFRFALRICDRMIACSVVTHLKASPRGRDRIFRERAPLSRRLVLIAND